MTPPGAQSLTATLDALATRSVSASELVEQALRAAETCSELGAFVVIDEARARTEAAHPRPGRLSGLPVAVKDMIDVAGLPTRAGSRATDATPATHDAAIVTRLRDAGAIVIGKTATHELAYGVTTPAVANPRDSALTAGGSSGGSAAAVATGIVALALGTDTAGSVRIPAICCGVCGLIGAGGQLPRAGVRDLSPSFDTLGPIVAEPADLALAWTALEASPGVQPVARLQRVLIADPETLGRLDPTAMESVNRIADRLKLPVAIVRPPSMGAWGAPRGIVIGAEALAAHRATGLWPDRRERLGEEIREAHCQAVARADAEVAAARVELARLSTGLRAAIGPGEVLLTPALPFEPPPRDRSNREVVGRLTRLLAPVNTAGLAAAVVPEGACGVQLVAADVTTVLAAAARL